MVKENAGQNWTVLDLLEWTTAYFRRAGIDDPRLNAEVLLCNVLGTERIMLYARFDRPVQAEKRRAFRELVKRRAAREPLQYLVGKCEFYGRNFALTPDVLIPRQETETVIEACLDLLPGDGAGSWAIDVGTGSGAIGVTLAAERAALHVIATDLSPQALGIAAHNAARHGVQDRVILARGDLLAPAAAHLPEGRSGVELIVANPPYVPSADIAVLAPEVRDHEPTAALDGGPDGLDVIRRLLPQAASFLLPAGHFVMEMGAGQADAVVAAASGTSLFDMTSVQLRHNGGNVERVFCVRRANSGD
jgi:release factor glutamine methyltransferase